MLKMQNPPHSVEEEIEHFLENFKYVSSLLDEHDIAVGQDQSGMQSHKLVKTIGSGSLSTNESSASLSSSSVSPVSPLDSSLTTVSTGVGSPYDSIRSSIYSEVLKRSSLFSSSSMGSFETAPLVFPIVESEPRFVKSYSDYVMGETSCTLTVIDVADALQAGYAQIPGSKSQRGSPMIIFPDRPNVPEISDDQYKNLITYLTSVPSMQEVDLGFSVLVDRRGDKWASVKTLLLRISNYFPGLVQEVFVLRPSGFFQRTFADMGFKFVRDEFKFKVLMLNSLEELREHVAKEQLTEEFGGTLLYNHEEWVQHRAAIEKFSANTSQIGESLRELCQRLQETDFPNNVESTETLIHDHEVAHREIKDDLKSTINHGEILLGCFKTVKKEDGTLVEVTSAELPASRLIHVTAVERLLVQLEETDRNFDEFWDRHDKKLGQCLQLRKFEDEFKQLQFTVEQHLSMFEGMNELGDSVQRVDSLITEFRDFELESKEDIDKADQLRQEGEQFIEDDYYAVDCIRPKCIELQRMCEQYKELLRRRNEMLQKSRDLQDRIDKANKWCTAGVDLLASQQIEKCNTLEGAQIALQELSLFMDKAADVKLNNPKEFRSLFETVMTEDAKFLHQATKNHTNIPQSLDTAELSLTVQDVLKRLDDVRSMCEKRQGSLHKFVERPVRPVQTVSPSTHRLPYSQSEDEDLERKRKKSGGKFSGKDRAQSVEVLKPDWQDNQHVRSGESDDSDTQLRDLDTLQQKRRKKRKFKRHVMRELIETERIYVEELKSILDSYSRELDNPYNDHMIPALLKGKRNLLFGNLEEIYNFHANVFLRDLENCKNTPALVGKCFVDRNEEFQMYSLYCQNKVASELLIREVGDNNPFFKECQMKANHKLPLGAYLLKPVQRITKYQLLLKEMLKYIQEGEVACKEQLQEAVDAMLQVVKYVNDIMHTIAITGFSGKLSDQGKLLMQGSFSVWTEHKKDKISLDLRFKPMQRQIFLYEKLVLFCKKKEDPNDHKASYIFKSSLDMSRIGLTETVKDKKKFEIWSHGRADVFIIQAPSVEVKQNWVSEIKRVLQQQLLAMKELQKAKSLGEVLPSSQPSSPGLPFSKQTVENTANNNMNTQLTITAEKALILPPDEHIPHYNSNSASVSDQTSNCSIPSSGGENYGSTGDFNNSSSTSDLPASSSSDFNLAPASEQGQQASLDEAYEEDEGWSSEEFEPEEGRPMFRPQSQDIEYQQFLVLADYTAMEESEISLHEGDVVDVIKIGSEGWWFVHNLASRVEGWAPASYLESNKRRSTYSAHSTLSEDSCDSRGIGRDVGSLRSTSSNRSGSSRTSWSETLV